MKSRIPEQEVAGKLNGDIQMTSYDLNKQLILSLGSIKDEELDKFKNIFSDYIEKNQDEYFMLLCKEQSYYTVFHYEPRNRVDSFTNILLEIINSVGEFYNYNIDKATGGIEIWIKPEGKEEVFAYYFFPYDAGVVKI